MHIESVIYKMEKHIKLTEPLISGGLSLLEAISKRRSSRDFSTKEIDMQVLSTLLWAAFGRNRAKGRTAPSSHNRQEIELYVAMKGATYIYDPSDHSLILQLEEDLRNETGEQDFVGVAPINLIYVSDTSKITGKTDQGIIEATYCDTGCISENVYLYCASVGLGTVVRAMINKELLSRKLGLGANQIITLAQTVGWLKE
jgi:SagB-type dehydrogenase family enzyme